MKFIELGRAGIDIDDIYAFEMMRIPNPNFLVKVDDKGNIVADGNAKESHIVTRIYFKSRVGMEQEYLDVPTTEEEYLKFRKTLKDKTENLDKMYIPVARYSTTEKVLLNENGGSR